MDSRTDHLDWDQLLPVRRFARDAGSFHANHSGKTILLTGAGGSIGSALARELATTQLELLILLDHSEQNLYEIESELAALPDSAPYLAVLGDGGDGRLLNAVFAEHRPSLIYHAAAFKHVPLMEANPFAAIRNNALATWELGRLASQHQVPQLLLISTDKAANPRSIMGASKRLAELAVHRWNSQTTRCAALRLGNVLGSHGSVIPLFLQQIARGGPLTVTHRSISRYFLTIQDTVNLIFSIASLSEAGDLFLPEMGEPIRIHDLAERLIRLAAPGAQKQITIEITGLRPGDKLLEDLLSPGESLQPTSLPDIHRIVRAQAPAEGLDKSFRAVSAQVENRDLTALLDSIRALVPEYEPSQTLLQRISAPIESRSSSD